MFSFFWNARKRVILNIFEICRQDWTFLTAGRKSSILHPLKKKPLHVYIFLWWGYITTIRRRKNKYIPTANPYHSPLTHNIASLKKYIYNNKSTLPTPHTPPTTYHTHHIPHPLPTQPPPKKHSLIGCKCEGCWFWGDGRVVGEVGSKEGGR